MLMMIGMNVLLDVVGRQQGTNSVILLAAHGLCRALRRHDTQIHDFLHVFEAKSGRQLTAADRF
jgi:hypothetical protein